MSVAFERYKTKEEEVFALRADQTNWTEDAEDCILDEMDHLWWSMSKEEQDESNARGRARYAAIE